jgi:formylglycine-generating enzyme required for sulfatase activity
MSRICLLVLAICLFFAGCGKQQAGNGMSAVKTELVPLTNMVLIKPATFQRLKFPVTLTNEYWIGKYEVTQREYADLAGTNVSYFKTDLNCPVEMVSFTKAMEYCAALTKREREQGRLPGNWEYRLPTEAEWEYACRAGSTNRFSFGDDEARAGEYAWTAENSDGATHSVGQKLPNTWGLYDAHGNVWEWCMDWFAPYPAMHLTNPIGPSTGKFKVFRGGGWDKEAKFARVPSRFMMEPANGINFVGFRLVLARVADSK